MKFDEELQCARDFVEQQQVPGTMVFCALSGAHMYGFPSKDSDLDLKGAYQADTRKFLGLEGPPGTYDTTSQHNGFECDFTALELGKSLQLLLSGNGNTLEQLTCPLQVFRTKELDALRDLALGSLSKRFGRHYYGFLRGRRREFETTRYPEVKNILYGYRVAATGLHLLLEKQVNANLVSLAPMYGFSDVGELIERKTCGEHLKLTEAEKRALDGRWDQLEALLDGALARTSLPEQPPNTVAVESWLIQQRVGHLDRNVAPA